MADNTKVMRCNACANNRNEHVQNEYYGKYNRVHNISESKGVATCTVCGNKKNIK